MPAKDSREDSRSPLALDGQSITRDDLERLARGRVRLTLTPACRERVKAAREVIDRALSSGEAVYGVNTGFGRFCRVRISDRQVRRLQANLVRSHGCGVGDPLDDQQVRLTVAFRANALARGHSGIREETLELLLALFNQDVLPWIPRQGSVGASGDLAPLAHLAQVLIGEGKARVDGRWLGGRAALGRRGLSPVRLEAKEGLSLINGVQPSCALLASAVMRSTRILDAAELAGAVTLEALLGSQRPFDRRIHEVRAHSGQARVARRLRELLEGSQIIESHRDCGRVQDAYSLRCIPQVHGAVRDVLDSVEKTLLVEVNSATDNPLVFAEEGDIISGGNFHGAPIAYAADFLAIALTDLGTMSERRIERLVNPDLSGLPPFLSRQEGLESGYMLAQVTAASLASENKVWSHPASVDTIPTSAGTEDHVSMSTTAARKLLGVVQNLETLVGIELIVGVHALEHRRPLRSGPRLEESVRSFRESIPRKDRDRDLSDEIRKAADWVRSFTP